MKGRILAINLLVIIILSSTVYGIVFNDSKDIGVKSIEASKERLISNTVNLDKIDLNSNVKFIKEISGLSDEDSRFLYEECNEKNLDLFMVMGIMRVESNFRNDLVGGMGERGIGQLMENTAKPLAKNLGIKYDPNKLFNNQYNILLFTTQLKYLNEIYNGDPHKTLTAYNRGQYGLKKYIASRSSRRNPAISTYSQKVMKYRNTYYNQFYK